MKCRIWWQSNNDGDLIFDYWKWDIHPEFRSISKLSKVNDRGFLEEMADFGPSFAQYRVDFGCFCWPLKVQGRKNVFLKALELGIQITESGGNTCW